MKQEFPKYNPNRLTADKGVTLVKTLIENEFGWIFRPTPLEHDFGIDGYIDIVNDQNYITGKSIAIQIKTGSSYFTQPTNSGWKYNGELKHLNYYLNVDNPVLIVIVDLEVNKAFWTEFDTDRITRTKTGWTTNIDKAQFLNKTQKNILQALSGFEIDYLPQLEHQWEMDKQMKESGIILLGVNKQEIFELNFSGFDTLLKRITSTDEMIKKCKGKISFVVFGYEEDPRELYQIEEVRKWAKEIIPIFKYWGYFLNMDEEISRMTGLMVLHLCSVDINILGPNPDNTGFLIEPDEEQTLALMQELFGWLNEFSDKYKISDEVNKERSMRVAKALGFNV